MFYLFYFIFIFIYLFIYLFIFFFFFFAHGPIKYECFLNRSICPIDGIQTGTTTSIQSGPGSNGNEGVFKNPFISRTRVSPSEAIKCYNQVIYNMNVLSPHVLKKFKIILNIISDISFSVSWLVGWLVLRHINFCWVILCPCQFNNYGLQLYTVQKCIMSTLVGLFYAKVSLTIMVSSYIQYRNL